MLLRAQGVAADATARVVAAAAEVFDPRRLRASQPFMLARTLEGALRRFEYEIDADRLLRIIPAGIGMEALHAEVLPIPKTLEQATIAAVIEEDTPSLYQAMDAAGERPELSIALAAVFSGEIDFNTELQPADRFAVAFERFSREAGPFTYGEITAAEFASGGRVVRAIRFAPPGAQTDYYDENGRSLRRFFLRSPLKFEPRITSRFSRSRMHPVLDVNRAHRGVDYGAPQGSPVVAVASGTVLSATYDRANGRMVRLRHSGGYESYYLHLSAFASGVRTGARVSQSDVIGYVGATGLATGPHLHYGLRKNGVFVNPLVEHRNMPPGVPVPVAAMEAFRAVRDRGLAQLNAASGSLSR
jgi:murein DD-endopeptidase MepM/ murein hydrolase activator NlpD